MIPVSSWGRLGEALHQPVPISPTASVAGQLGLGGLPGIAFGMGRSYGDVCLNPDGTLWLMSGCDNWLSFNPDTGVLRCQAGVLLGDIQKTLSAHGWMLPVTPGTQFVTVGGAIANDVHGKNHHRVGTFGDHVLSLTLARTDRSEPIACSTTINADWFKTTIGGLGLTGVITDATLQLQHVNGPWLDTDTIAFTRLEDFFQLAHDSEADWEYTVSWIDCLNPSGRGIFLRANHAHASSPPGKAPHARKLSVPMTPPLSMVNQLTLKPFNELYYRSQKHKQGRGISHYEPFFYPLDNVLAWNRMYGPRGFYQYQCVVPHANGQAAIKDMLAQISQSGQGSFLAVLKTFGNRAAPGLLSFAQPGITLALDFPNQGDATLKLLNQLDAITSEAGGRIYPAKDARMSADFFRAGYPALDEFSAYRDPGISSAMSRRLMGY